MVSASCLAQPVPPLWNGESVRDNDQQYLSFPFEKIRHHGTDRLPAQLQSCDPQNLLKKCQRMELMSIHSLWLDTATDLCLWARSFHFPARIGLGQRMFK